MTIDTVGPNGFLALDSPIAATDTILFVGISDQLNLVAAFDAATGNIVGGTLEVAAPLVDFAFGDSLLLTQSTPITSVAYVPASPGNATLGGTLGLFDGTQMVGALTLVGDYTDDTFLLTDGYTPQINLAESGSFGLSAGTGAAEAETWQGLTGGAFGDPANWSGVAAPGSLDSATITGASSNAFLVVTGPGSAANLETDGLVALDGDYVVGALALGTQEAATELLLAAASDLSADVLTATGGQIDVTGSAAVLSVANLGSLDGTDLIVTGGAQATIGANTTSSAAPIIIGAGATLAGNGLLDAVSASGQTGTLLDDGLLAAAGGMLDIAAVLSGDAVVQVDDGAALFLAAGVAPGSALDFQLSNGATIGLIPGNDSGDAITLAGADDTVFFTPGQLLAPISGFGIGDTVLLAETPSAEVTTANWVNGTLELFGTNGSVLGSVVLTGVTSGQILLTPQVGGTMAQVNLAESDPYGVSAGTQGADAYEWIGPIGGAWGDPSNWIDLSTGQTQTAPGNTDTVTLVGPTSGATDYLVVQGPGQASTLSVTGDVAVAGRISADSLTLAGNLVAESGASLLVGGVMTASGNSAIMVADTLSAIEVGGQGLEEPGQVVIDTGATLIAGGTIIAPLGVAIGGTLIASSMLAAYGALTGSGTVVTNSDFLAASGLSANAALTFVDNATLSLPSAISASNNIVLGGPGVTLNMSGAIDGTTLAARIADLSVGDVLNIQTDTYVTAATPLDAGGGTVLALLGGQGTVASLLLSGDQTGLAYNVADTALASGGYEVSITTALACYAAGTRLAVPDGEVPVETLRPGDLVRTAAGRCAPVRWVGHRDINAACHPHPEQVWPIRIAANAFAASVPRRSLFLSPDHAIWENGALLLARDLVNGRSIKQVPVDTIAYWHVELDCHDLLLAEGLAAESYLDAGNRQGFVGGGVGPQLAPTGTPHAATPFAKHVLDGPTLVAAKARLFRRAGPTTGRPNPFLSLRTRGAPLSTTQPSPGVWQVASAGDDAEMVLASSAWVPAEHIATSLDRRQLGVRVLGVWRNGVAVALDGPVCGAGFYPLETTAEGPCRWTNGAGTLSLPEGAASWTLLLGDAPQHDNPVTPRIFAKASPKFRRLAWAG